VQFSRRWRGEGCEHSPDIAPTGLSSWWISSAGGLHLPKMPEPFVDEVRVELLRVVRLSEPFY